MLETRRIEEGNYLAYNEWKIIAKDTLRRRYILNTGEVFAELLVHGFDTEEDVGREKTLVMNAPGFPFQEVYGIRYCLNDDDYLAEFTLRNWFPSQF